ncbi:MAG: hypothetical protein HY060_11630 [Proteobacteria bacterium]|nr:hypothetical protein [Pseudomonadota bacterium]
MALPLAGTAGDRGDLHGGAAAQVALPAARCRADRERGGAGERGEEHHHGDHPGQEAAGVVAAQRQIAARGQPQP